MKTIIAVGGRPGTGKTALMRSFMRSYDWEATMPLPMLKAHYTHTIDTHVLGSYGEDVFSGTDRLPMNIAPTAERFVSETNGSVVYEGDRLFTYKFLRHCQSHCDRLIIVCLEAAEDSILMRYQQRGSTQSSTFLKGRATKVANILSHFNCVLLTNNTEKQLTKNTEYLHDLLTYRQKASSSV